MMTMRREVDGLKEAGAGGDAGDEDKDTKYDVDDEIDEHIMTKADVVQMGEAENRAQSRT
jgi:hypothetical protein